MQKVKLDYRDSLCLAMLRFAAMNTDLRPSDIKEKLEAFFPRKNIDAMTTLICSNDKDIIEFTQITPHQLYPED